LGDQLQDQVAAGSIPRGEPVPVSSRPPGVAPRAAADQLALGAAPNGVIVADSSRPPGAVDPKATAQHALAGGNFDDALLRLTRSLRAGLAGPGLRDSGLIAQFPGGADPFEFFGSPQMAVQDDSTVRPSRDLPEIVHGQTLGALDPGGPGAIGRRVALMAQDMAAFGGVSREASPRFETHREGLRFDYFA